MKSWRPMLWPDNWKQPETLDIVKNTQIDCLLLDCRGTSAIEQWRDLAAAARRVGLTPVAILDAEGRGAARAAEAGFAAVASAVKPAAPIPWIQCMQRDELSLSATGDVVAIEGCAWPKVATRANSDAFETGPTGHPWIDSNGWLVQLVNAHARDSRLWIRSKPASKKDVIPARDYAVALADAEAAGARWVIELDPHLEAELGKGNAEALQTWRRLLKPTGFSGGDAPARRAGIVAAVSDFSGANEFLSHEFLNLMVREVVPTRVMPKAGLTQEKLAGISVAVYLDIEPPAPPLKKALTEFAHAGGTLITSPDAGFAGGTPVEGIPGYDFMLRSLGKGRLAIGLDSFDDPSTLVAATHILQGRGNDLVRLTNASAMNTSMWSAADGGGAVVHIVNYAGRPAVDPVSVTLLRKYRRARFRSSDQLQDKELPIKKEGRRTALYLPKFSVYARLELEA